jgi:hypothetical protein
MLFPNSDSVYDRGSSPSSQVFLRTRPSSMTMLTLLSSIAAMNQSIFSRKSISPYSFCCLFYINVPVRKLIKGSKA